MSYNPHIRLNPEQLQMIEDALRGQISQLAQPERGAWNEHAPDKGAIRNISKLLGHLHDQKFWHRPDEAVPMG